MKAWNRREVDGNFFRHPFVRWYRGKSGVFPSTIWDLVTGRDFLGYKTNRFDLVERFSNLLPFYVQEALEQRQGSSFMDIAAVVGAEYLGFTTISARAYKKR